jgi:hypothetical protein
LLVCEEFDQDQSHQATGKDDVAKLHSV